MMPTITWNPNDKGSNVVLSNNNLTANVTGNYSTSSVRSNNYFTSGKYYCELTVNSITTGSFLFGVANKSLNITTSVYTSVDQLSYYSYNGNLCPNSSAYGTLLTVNDVLSMIIDLDNKTISFAKNGEWYGSKTLPTWSNYYVFLGTASSLNNTTITVNFGATSFKYSIPSGYKKMDNMIKYLIKQGTSYYSIKPEFYANDQYNSLALTGSDGMPNDADYTNLGFDDVGVLTDIYNTRQVNSTATTLGSGNMFTFNIPSDFKSVNDVR